MKKTLLVLLVAAVAFAWSAPEFGSLKDLRDGQTYKTVKIGKQTWMAQNLNYATDSSYCYNDNPDNCAKYGRLYTWDAAMKACPTGWHLPTSAEWDELVPRRGAGTGAKLKSKEWGGRDAVGFRALPAGKRNYYGGGFRSVGAVAVFWTATERDDYFAEARYILPVVSERGSDITELDWINDNKDAAFSVRCVKD